VISNPLTSTTHAHTLPKGRQHTLLHARMRIWDPDFRAINIYAKNTFVLIYRCFSSCFHMKIFIQDIYMCELMFWIGNVTVIIIISSWEKFHCQKFRPVGANTNNCDIVTFPSALWCQTISFSQGRILFVRTHKYHTTSFTFRLQSLLHALIAG
jgi:hypothetical protein